MAKRKVKIKFPPLAPGSKISSEKLIVLSDSASPTGDKSVWMLARYNMETKDMTILEFGEGEIPQRVLDMKEEAGR